MKKYLFLILVATTLVACDKSELESAEETIAEKLIILKAEDKQSAEWKLFNSKIIGAKDDAPQGKQSDYPKDNKTD